MSYELPPDEQKNMRKLETFLMVVFGGLIAITMIAVVYSKFRPLPNIAPAARPSDSAKASPSRQADEQRIPPLPPPPR